MTEMKAQFGTRVLERLVVEGVTLLGLTGVNVIIARTLGAEGKGAFTLAMLASSVLFVFSSFGFHQATSYFRGRKNESYNTLVTHTVLFSVISSIVFAGIFVVLYPIFQNRFFAGLPAAFIFISLLVVPFLHFQSTFTNFLMLSEKHRFFNLISALKILVHVGLVFILLVVCNFGIYATLWAWVVSQALMSLASIWMVVRTNHVKFSYDHKLMAQTFVFGLRGYFGNFVYFINKRLDVIMVSFFLPLTQVGIYSVATSLSEILLQLPVSVATLLFPRVAGSTDKDSNDFTPRIFRNILFMLIVIGIIAILLGRLAIVLLFGADFEAGVVPLYIMIPGVVLAGASTILGNDLVGRGRLEIHSFVAALGFALNIALNALLIPKYGLTGAAVASSAAYALITLALIIIFQRITRVPLRDLFILRKGDFQYFRLFLEKLHLIPSRSQQ